VVAPEETVSQPPPTEGKSPVVAGFIAAAITVLLLIGWRLFARWYRFGAAFTDLPGQDSLALLSRLEIAVFAVIILVAGRLAGFLCVTRRGIAAVIGVSPLLLPALLLFLGFGQFLEAVIVGALICLIGLCGAYAPGWLSRRSVGVSNRAV
jgi:hypothetical protein